MKPHTFAEMINKVRDLAFDFGTTEQFRDRVSALLGEYVPIGDDPGEAVVVPEHGFGWTRVSKWKQEKGVPGTIFVDIVEVLQVAGIQSIPADRVLKQGQCAIGIYEMQMFRDFAARRMSHREYDRLEACRDAHEAALRSAQAGEVEG
jgi:hypothetical protein